jgi:alpha-1,3/alpha-1,6-mannosyltransferase
MARGTPVIAMNSGGPVESVRDGLSGFLMAKDPKEWAKKMEVMGKDGEMRKKIGEYARKYACEEFSLRKMGEKMTEKLIEMELGIKS